MNQVVNDMKQVIDYMNQVINEMIHVHKLHDTGRR